jgi:ATP-dependent 26S proteasome regulatory subunit
MSEPQQWQANNDAYLAAAVEWVRLSLAGLAVTPAFGLSAPKKRSFFARLFLGDEPQPETRPAAPNQKQIARARSEMAKCAAVEPPPAALILQRQCGLSDFELEVLLLCAAIELDTRVAGLCAQALEDPARTYPTFALALALFPNPAWDVLSPDRPLRYWHLIDIVRSPATPLTAAALRADERIVNYIKGLNHLDERLSAHLTLLGAPGSCARFELPPSQQSMAATLGAGLAGGHLPELIHLLGPDSASKKAVASEVAGKLSLALYLVSADSLPASPQELEALARTWRREALLLPVALYVDARDAERDFPPVTRFLARSRGLMFLDTRENWRISQKDALTLEVARPTRTEQRDTWQALVNDPQISGLLASQFQMSLSEIHRAYAAAAGVDDAGIEVRLWEACRSASRPKLDVLGQRLEPKAGWDDLVLPDAEQNLLREMVTHARQRMQVFEDWGFSKRMNRGFALSALFAGDSGTGKTMAAEVIANELKLNLYRIDLSAVVSKYIGETEKNLRQVFDAAEDGGTILFFDEADALFGKRSEVKDSHDRYANIEINYLLQRMESYSGIAILATNLKNALDTAFLRRLRFVVHFPFPGLIERKRIWERAFPEGLPKQTLDLGFLARLNVAGGTIHNIAIKSAFLAAGEKRLLSMAHVLEAARTEFRKLERPINEADFQWQAQRAGAVA